MNVGKGNKNNNKEEEKFIDLEEEGGNGQQPMRERALEEQDRQIDKLVTTGPHSPEQMAQESDTLVQNAIPCGQYQSLMDRGEPIQLDDIDECGEPQQQPQTMDPQQQPRGEHRRRRMRYLSQGSTAGAGTRRPTAYSGRIDKHGRRRRQLCGAAAPPRNVHCNDWREMLEITRRLDEGDGAMAFRPMHKSAEDLLAEEDRAEELHAVEAESLHKFPSTGSLQQLATGGAGREREVARMRYVSGGSSLQCDWIEQTFSKRECIQFIPSSRDSNKCGCGRYRNQHVVLNNKSRQQQPTNELPAAKRWSIQRHTMLAPTDAYGTLEFQGGPHPFKAQYLRMSFDSDPADIMCLFEHVWQMEPPKLIITIHGGITNFDLQPKLARVFRKGLLKAARTTGAWIFTSGINAGVVRQVAAALESAIPSSRSSKIVSVGIAPWGLLKRREDFTGRDKVVLYHPQSFPPKTRFAVLNNRHSFFLLVDNGTVGRYGADIILRRRLESYIAEKQKIGGGTHSVPVVCVVLEGGTCTIRTVLDYVTTIPKVPVVICDGTGRASDLLAFAHQYIQEDGNLPEVIRPQLLSLIEDVFFYDKHNAHCLVMDILACVRQRNLITVFRLGENQKQDVDYAILTALLKGHNLSPAEQLSLALAWNRVDIARSDIFVMGQDWPKIALHNAMMDALIHNRVDFVRLLLENGVSMHEFLTISRLEELYNTDQGPPNTLYYIVRDVVKIRAGYRYKLPHIGMAVEKLMANGFRSHYTSAQFRHKYGEYKNRLKESQRRLHNHHHHLHPDPILSTASPASYHRCVSEFFTSRGFPGTLPNSASDTRLGFGAKDTTTLAADQMTVPNTSRAGQQQQHSSAAFLQPQSQHQHHHGSAATFTAPMPAISGSRALSNHIMWRTAYRRENIAAAANKQSAATKSPPLLTQSQSVYQFGTLNNDTCGGGPFITEPVGYAAEADESLNIGGEQREPDFRYPFSDLLIWAVLTKRHEMALCMWQHGEEAMAKALVACRLYKSLAKEAAEDYLEVEVCEELKKYAEEFRQLSLELLDHCYKQDDAQTLQLLTYELLYWSQETCLSLAVIVNNKAFLAHPCCQILLADLWHGGLRIRSNSNLKVILGILFPPSIFLLEFKSREELMLQPQTAAEHQDDINDSSSSESSSSSSSSSESSDSDNEANETDGAAGVGGAEKGIPVADRRRTSHGSVQSLNFTSIFQSKRKRHRPSQIASNVAAGQNTNDLELGKVKQRDSSQQQSSAPAVAVGKEERRAKRSSRPASSVLSGGDRESMKGGGAVAMAAQSTLGTALAGTGGSPSIFQSSQSPLNNPISSAHSSPARVQTSQNHPTMQNQIPVTPLHIDTSAISYQPYQRQHQQQQQRAQPKMPASAQFTLGSIGENVGGHPQQQQEEDGTGSLMSTPRHLLLKNGTNSNNNNNNNMQTGIDDHYANSTPTSPNHVNFNATHLLNNDPAHHPKMATSPHWDFVGPGLTKVVDQVNRLTANGGYVPKGIPLPEGVTLNKKRQIKFRRKLYEFFVAPITTFWAWTLSFVVFLSILTYVLLIRTPLKPTILEWYLLAYVIGFGIEITRKFLMCGPKKLGEKFAYFFGNYWNFLTAVAIIGFIIGFIFRMNPSTSKSVGRIILAVDSVLWTVKLLDFLGVFPRFGPYITMAGKMIMNMSSIIVMLGISLLGFGLARQSITYPNEEWHWLLLRNVFYKPYFMLYGEVYADEIDTCGDEAWDEHLDKNVSIANAWTHRDARDRELACVSGHWIPPILMVVFLLIANILLISMLIAIFNNIFESTNKISQQIWLFQRYRQVMEYEATPFLPPPFTPVYHVWMVFKYLNYRQWRPCGCLSPGRIIRVGGSCFCCCFGRRRGDKNGDGSGIDGDDYKGACEEKKEKPPALAKNAFDQRRNLQQERLALFDFSLKLFLTDDQVEKLHDFEEECMEDLAREKEYERNRTNEERLHRTCERTEMILLRVNDLTSKETMLKGNVRELESRIEVMEDKQTEILEYLRQLTSVMPVLVQSIQGLQQQQSTPQPARNQSPYQIDSSSHLSIPEAGARIQTARSEGHIFNEAKHRRDSMVKRGTKKADELANPQLLPSVSVDHSAGAPAAPGLARMPMASDSLLAPEYRQKRAQSYGMGEFSAGSSHSTMYYPLKAGSTSSAGSRGQLEQAGEITAQRRTRTTTYGGAEFPPPSDGGNTLSSAGQHQRLFGSLISLEPSAITPAGTSGGGMGTNIQAGMIQSRRNTQRRHRLNDEYTSITDTINVEELTLKMAQVDGAETATKRFIQEEDGDETPRHRVHDEEVQTEEEEYGEEEEDEEDYDVDEDEEEEEEDEEAASTGRNSARSPKRRVKRSSKGDSPSQRQQQQRIAIEIDTTSLRMEMEGSSQGSGGGRQATLTRGPSFDHDDDIGDDEEEFGQSMGTEEGATILPRAATPNSALRRARSSFVHQQNTLFKSYEEDVGHPASTVLKKKLKKGKSLSAGVDEAKKRPAASPHSGNEEDEQDVQELKKKYQQSRCVDDASSSSSKEFISFKAQTGTSSRGDDGRIDETDEQK